MSVIRLSGVTKRFGSTIALDNVSLDVPAGVVFALLGENGAGKTTAIRILLGLEQPDGGAVDVLGLDSLRYGMDVRRRVGYVPERPTLYEWMTVDEIGWFTAGFYGGEYHDSYRRLVDDFALERKRKIKALSKGMRAKVALALAMAHRPELLVLDEPTSGLDTMVRREFLEGMVDWAARGQTVLLSSHQISEVERVADIVAIVRRGRVLLVERLEELKASMQELTITVADGLIGPPSVPGEVLRERRRARQWQLVVRGFDEADFERLRLDESIVDVHRRTPALEEIFLAYMQGGVEDLDRVGPAVPAGTPTAETNR
jgi:ABC-2 type transport system ATP-binding protein